MRRIPQDIEPLLREYRRVLVDRFGDRLLSVRLYGSRARGDADTESDVDVAVVVRGLTDEERAKAVDLAFEAWRSRGAAGPLIQPLIWGDAEQADRLRAERRIALDIDREGIPV